MIDLKQAVCDIKAEQLDVISLDSPQWEQFYQANNGLFTKVQKAKPNRLASHHLLGLLTKAHIEALSQVETHHSSVKAMKQAFKQELGEEHAANFHYSDGEQLIFVTHLWLYLQGYLAMDFSLANDHAEQTATAIAKLNGGDSQVLRTSFMASFYQAKTRSNGTKSGNRIVDWVKKLLH